MLKRIMAVTAVSGLALTSALAQSSTTSPSTSTPSTTATAPSASTTGKAAMVTKQAPDQMLASKFKGTDVVGTNDEKIGDVNDILFDKNKQIVAYVVGVGGFLGIGARDVAIEPASFQVVPGKDASDYKLRLSMTKDELKAAEAFEPYTPPRPATSDATPPMGAPAPATRPSTSSQ